MFNLVFTDEKKIGYAATKALFEKCGKPIIKKVASRLEVVVSFPTMEEAEEALKQCSEACSSLRPLPVS